MEGSELKPTAAIQNDTLFPLTSWTTIINSQRSPTEEAHRALAKMCGKYRTPIRNWFLHLSRNPHESEELTQEFFQDKIMNGLLAGLDRNREGKFRSFLKLSCKRFLIDEKRRKKTLKSSVNRIPEEAIDWDQFPADFLNDAEQAFDLNYAKAVHEVTVALLTKKYHRNPQMKFRFKLLFPCVFQPKKEGYAAESQQLGISEGTAAKAAHDMREKYAQAFRDEVLNTVGNAEDLETETRYLMRLLINAQVL